MRTRTALVLTVSMVVVLIALGSRPASAQGSATIPTGGGSAYQVSGPDDAHREFRQPIQSWFPHTIGWGRFLPLTRSVVTWNRSSIPVAYRSHWWGVKASR